MHLPGLAVEKAGPGRERTGDTSNHYSCSHPEPPQPAFETRGKGRGLGRLGNLCEASREAGVGARR